jgi:hypothetical protein
VVTLELVTAAFDWVPGPTIPRPGGSRITRHEMPSPRVGPNGLPRPALTTPTLLGIRDTRGPSGSENRRHLAPAPRSPVATILDSAGVGKIRRPRAELARASRYYHVW